MEEALTARNGDPLQGELDNAMKRLGELTMENELLWARVRRPGPLAKRRSKK
jgi:transposase